jgi:hypothetical protein
MIVTIYDFLYYYSILEKRGTDLKARKTAAHGRVVSTIKSFHSPPVAQAISDSVQKPNVKPINWYIAIFVLLEVDDISIAVTPLTETVLSSFDIRIYRLNCCKLFFHLP